MTASPPRLLGSQEPTCRSCPPWEQTLGEEAAALAETAGLFLDPWQRLVLDDWCAIRGDARWATRTDALVVPRQNGKNAAMEARELAGLFLFGEETILHSAHKFPTAREAFLRLRSLILGAPHLAECVTSITTANGNEGIEVVVGGKLRRIKFLARSEGAGRGFFPDLIVWDEAYNLSDGTVEDAGPSQAARPNPKKIVMSSAPKDAGISEVLRRYIREGRSGAFPGSYIEWRADPGDDRSSPETWAKANPAYGIRISDEAVLAELAELTGEGFDRERLGIFAEVDADAEWAIPKQLWEACADPKSVPGGRRVVGVDAYANHAAVGLCADHQDGYGYVETLEARSGTRWAVDKARDLSRLGATVVADEKCECLQDLQDAIPGLVVANTKQATQAAAMFDTAVREAQVRHLGPEQPELSQALSAAARRDVGDGWAWSRKKSAADVTPLVACTLAYWGWRTLETRGGWMVGV